MQPDRVDWDALRRLAVEAAAAAYCPYSGLQVGAAALVDDCRVVIGCNVENGGGRLVALACRSGTGELLMPCGRCRQVIYEFGGSELLVDTPTGPETMTWVLPAAFGPEHLPAERKNR